MLDVALDAASKAGIPKNRVFILEMPKELTGQKEATSEFKTVGQLISDGKGLAPIDKLRWKKGQGARQTAFLCYSSGTSGLPVSIKIVLSRELLYLRVSKKGVMISHRNVIANTLQVVTHDIPQREALKKEHGLDFLRVVLGLLPYSHIYGLVAVCHVSVYSGDKTVCLPKFEMKSFLQAIQTQKIDCLYLVCPFELH